MVNANGVRFVDEGADFRNYTYAKYGAVILSQPQQFAWQIFDSKVLDRLRDEYRIKRMTKVRADTIEELAKKLEGVDEQQFLKTIKEWNAAVMTEVPFNPAVKDGRCTRGLAVPKSNWANTIDEPPFEAYAVTCGLTFTFGGLKITNEGEVESTDGHADSRPVRRRRAGGRAVLSQLSRRHRAWCPARCWASWRATAPGGTFRARIEQERVGGNHEHAHAPPRARARLDRPPPALGSARPGRLADTARSPSSSAMPRAAAPTSWRASSPI